MDIRNYEPRNDPLAMSCQAALGRVVLGRIRVVSYSLAAADISSRLHDKVLSHHCDCFDTGPILIE